jgi:hypothetical protein
MTVTDPDVPDPLNDPRTSQADPGAYGQGADLASAEDEPAAAGEEELAAGQTEKDDAGGGDDTGGGLPAMGGIPDSGGREPEPDIDTGAPFTQVAPPS